jgi:all-trans-8'-apo-beta-carotenal 15,15'-oxygenase
VYSLAHSAGAECGPFDRLADVDLETGRARTIEVGARQFPSEPVLAPPWMLTLVYDAQAHASHVAVFDTRRPDEGPVTRVHFDHHVPFTLHGTWCNEPLSGG